MAETPRDGGSYEAPPSEYPEGNLDLGAYLRLFLEYRWWIAGVTLAAVVAGALYAFLATPVYTATATLFLDRGQQKAPKELGNVVSTDLTVELFYNSQVEIMKSKEVAQRAFEKCGLARHPLFAGEENPLEAFRKMITVQRKRESALFTVSVTAPDRENVAAWANAVADAYDEVTLQNRLKILREADRLMGEEAAKMEKEYQRLKRLYGDQLAASGSYFPENQKEILDKRIETLELKRGDVEVRYREVSSVVDQVSAIQSHGGDPVPLPSTAVDPALQDMTQQYNDMVRDLSRLLVKFTPQHPDVVSLRSRIARQGEAILTTYRHQLAALSAERASLEADLGRLKAEAIAATQRSGSSESLAAGVEAMRKYMELLVEKMREVDVAANLLSNTVQVVDRAETPTSPSRPKKRMVLLLALLLGLMASTGSVLLLNLVDQRIKDPDVIEKRTGLPLFAVLPRHSPENHSFSVEAFLNLRTSLVYASDHKARKTWMVASASSGEGKSTVVANLAITLASAGEKVLLVDSDLRKPSLHRYFGVELEPGLAGYLASEEEDVAPFLKNPKKENLALLTAGKVPANPPILFDMEKFHRFLVDSRLRYDWVLFDAPPVLAVTDALVLASHVDGVLLVARHRDTHLPLVERALAEFARIGREVAGGVLNDFELARSSYYYNYYSRHYRYYYGKDAPLAWWQRLWKAATGRRPRGGGSSIL
jgi:capsular exopolysaccharide synthesis family protein